MQPVICFASHVLMVGFDRVPRPVFSFHPLAYLFGLREKNVAWILEGFHSISSWQASERPKGSQTKELRH